MRNVISHFGSKNQSKVLKNAFLRRINCEQNPEEMREMANSKQLVSHYNKNKKLLFVLFNIQGYTISDKILHGLIHFNVF